MAKHVILEGYTFTPATKTLVVTGKNIRREQLLLITNTTAGTVIYNFSDSSLLASSYVNAVDSTSGQETTTIVFAYNTAAMNASDKISIMTEETYQEITPAEVMRDPVDKLRVSNPQSLIDTDFEYGIQNTKWESLSLLNNRPSAYYDPTQPITGTSSSPIFSGSSSTYVITNVTASGKVVTVTVANTTGITVGTPIFVQGTLDNANADGWWVVEVVTGSTSFSYTVTNTPAAALFDVNKTYVYMGTFFTGAVIPMGSGTTQIVVSTVTATVTTTNAHGLRVGDGIYVVATTGVSGLNSSWVVATTPTNNTFTFTIPSSSGTVTTQANANLYTRSLGYIQHRAFDGGVQFTNASPYHGYQVIRQTRRYFRYQSGKGIQFSTGSSLKPTIPVDNIASSGTTVTVTTKFAHGLQPGATVNISGATVAATGLADTAYNGTFTVVTAANPITFTYTALSVPAASPAFGFPLYVTPNTWYGGSNRIGMFDSQNGFYFEYDGQTLYAVRRNSVRQLSGSALATNASQSVVGTSTKFSSELKPGDFVVIRGTNYLVQQITSDTQMYIYPEYRGVTAATCQVSKTTNIRIPQSAWNIDKMDGTGSSLMNLDLSKMQMFYIDYTWYGAGAIRFGFKNNRGEIIYCHRMPNNNVNYEAYMRSGNLPARYETTTVPVSSYLTATLSSATTASMSVSDTSLWPTAGTVVLTQAAATTGVIEYITYTGKTSTTITGLTRGVAGGSAATTFTYSATAPIQVELSSPTCASTINHWGSSVIMDGKFDDDKSFVFNAGMNTVLTNQAANGRYALMSIRLAPSVDNGLTGLLGVREILNRMQLTPRGMDSFTSGAGFRIELVLNGKPASGTFVPAGGSSLAQIAFHTSNVAIIGGESIYSFFTNLTGATSQDLNLVRDLGNSILGGGTTLTVPTGNAGLFPDGPDIVTVVATALGGTNTINARISWTEAQA